MILLNFLDSNISKKQQRNGKTTTQNNQSHDLPILASVKNNTLLFQQVIEILT